MVDKIDNPDEVFQKLEVLGEGSFGIVYKVLHKESANIVAAKIMDLDKELDRYLFNKALKMK